MTTPLHERMGEGWKAWGDYGAQRPQATVYRLSGGEYRAAFSNGTLSGAAAHRDPHEAVRRAALQALRHAERTLADIDALGIDLGDAVRHYPPAVRP